MVTVNEGLAFASASIVSIKTAPSLWDGMQRSVGGNGGLWLGSVVGAGFALYPLLKKQGLRSFDTFDRYAIGASCVGWTALLLNASNTLVSAAIAQGVSLVAGALFMRHQYRYPQHASTVGQLCYVGAAMVNAYTLSSLHPQELILAVGGVLTSSMCMVGLFAGHARVLHERRGRSQSH